MTTVQKVIKYCAIAFAIFLIVSIIGGIVSAVAGASFLFGGVSTVGDMQTYTVGDDIASLTVDVAAAELEVKTGDGFSVESNLKKLDVENKNGCLLIEEQGSRIGVHSNDAVVKVTIPADAVFEKVSITTGAGSVRLDRLDTDRLVLELGAGEVSIGSLVATEGSSISGGAGKITVSDGALANLELDMGVGELNLTSALNGDCDLNMGVGNADITLIGSLQGYTIELDKGIGDATVAGVKLGDDVEYGNGPHRLDIDGGVGNVTIEFKEAPEP